MGSVNKSFIKVLIDTVFDIKGLSLKIVHLLIQKIVTNVQIKVALN